VKAPTTRFSRTAITDGVCARVHWHNVTIVVWCGRATRDAGEAVVAFADDLARAYPRFSILHVVEDGVGLPTPEGRAALINAARRPAIGLTCVGVLLPRGNLVATLFHTFMRSARTLLRGLEIVVENDVPTLVRRFVAAHDAQTGMPVPAEELASAIELARDFAARSMTKR
jgi:hypothetical protein